MFRSARLPVIALLAALALASGCGRDPVTAPVGTSIRGTVRLSGPMTAADSHVLGTRYVDDATGIPVVLVSGTRVVASTFTNAGTFRFDGLAQGSYKVRVDMAGRRDSTAEMTLAAHDLVLATPLAMPSVGDLWPAPNPVDTLTQIGFALPAQQAFALRVARVDGAPVATVFVGMLTAGYHQVPWRAVDSLGASVPAGAYWLAYEGADGPRRLLLFH